MTISDHEKDKDMTGPMARQNLFAFTESGAQYPGFVSINREANGDITFHVRSAPVIREQEVAEGSQASFTIRKAEWEGFPFIAPA